MFCLGGLHIVGWCMRESYFPFNYVTFAIALIMTLSLCELGALVLANAVITTLSSHAFVKSHNVLYRE